MEVFLDGYLLTACFFASATQDSSSSVMVCPWRFAHSGVLA